MTARPSGTEPKIKYYFDLRTVVRDDDSLPEAEVRAVEQMDEIERVLGDCRVGGSGVPCQLEGCVQLADSSGHAGELQSKVTKSGARRPEPVIHAVSKVTDRASRTITVVHAITINDTIVYALAEVANLGPRALALTGDLGLGTLVDVNKAGPPCLVLLAL